MLWLGLSGRCDCLQQENSTIGIEPAILCGTITVNFPIRLDKQKSCTAHHSPSNTDPFYVHDTLTPSSSEIAFITVATIPHLIPGGYRALLLGPTFEGLVGGTSTLMATVYAYISDTTPDGSRATVFARLGGIAMAGFAVGPIVGSWVIEATGNM